MRSQCSAVIWRNGSRHAVPALFTSTSTPPSTRLRRLDQRGSAVLPADVGRDTVHVAGVPQVVHRTLDLVRVEAADDDGAPFLDEPAGRCRPDAAAATADEDSLAAKTAHSDLPLCSTC